jgi:quercetin dioxygenase-like cupin family protein
MRRTLAEITFKSRGCHISFTGALAGSDCGQRDASRPSILTKHIAAPRLAEDAAMSLKSRSTSNDSIVTGECAIESLVRRGASATYTDEYNCKLFRLYPWPRSVETKRALTEFGATWVVLEPGKQVNMHDHDEEESFIGVAGEAELIVGTQATVLRPGDIAYIPRSIPHSLINHSTDMNFTFIDIYWDFGGKSFARG